MASRAGLPSTSPSIGSGQAHFCCEEALAISSNFFLLVQPLSVLSLLRREKVGDEGKSGGRRGKFNLA